MAVQEFGREFEVLPTHLASFSRSLRSLYEDDVVSSDSSAAVKYRRLRISVTNDGLDYIHNVVPASAKFMESVWRLFEKYKELSEDEWCNSVGDILKKVSACKKNCETIIEMHNDILVRLKQRQDQATVIVRELKDLQEEYERKKREMEKSADKKSDWAIGLLFVPVVNLIATPILFSEAGDDSAKAAAHGVQANIEGSAARTIERSLIPTIESLIGGLHKVAGFFQIMELELGKYEGHANKGLETKKKLHYYAMRAEARKIDSACQSFHRNILVVQSNLRAIQ